jgi:hypothetical protein
MVARKLQESGKTNKLHSQKTKATWMLALNSVGLSEEQKGNVQLLVIELKNAEKEFYTLYGKEVTKLRTDARAAKKEGSTLSDTSRKRILELMEFAPDIVEYQDKVWKLLSVDQQNTFQIKYQDLLDEEAKRRLDNKDKGQLEAKDKDSRGSAPKDSKFNNRDSKPEVDRINRRGDSIDAASMRRIKFLRRLQELENES